MSSWNTRKKTIIFIIVIFVFFSDTSLTFSCPGCVIGGDLEGGGLNGQWVDGDWENATILEFSGDSFTLTQSVSVSAGEPSWGHPAGMRHLPVAPFPYTQAEWDAGERLEPHYEGRTTRYVSSKGSFALDYMQIDFRTSDGKTESFIFSHDEEKMAINGVRFNRLDMNPLVKYIGNKGNFPPPPFGVDIDFTTLSGTTFIKEFSNMFLNPKDYFGKTIRLIGPYSSLVDDDADRLCHYVLASNLYLEFVLRDAHEYPEDNAIIDITGVFDSYFNEGLGATILCLKVEGISTLGKD